jgi:malate synthase
MIQITFDSLLERLPQDRRRRVVLAAAVSFAVLLVIIAGSALVSKNRNEQRIASTGNNASGRSASDRPGAPQRAIIPPDEIFLPDEPDFVPGVLLERERRVVWTEEDAAPFWQDPLIDGEQQWRDRIEKTIDEIMENVP